MRTLLLTLLIAGCSSQIEGGNLPAESDQKTTTLIQVSKDQWRSLAGTSISRDNISMILDMGYQIKSCTDSSLKMCGKIQKVTIVTEK